MLTADRPPYIYAHKRVLFLIIVYVGFDIGGRYYKNSRLVNNLVKLRIITYNYKAMLVINEINIFIAVTTLFYVIICRISVILLF